MPISHVLSGWLRSMVSDSSSVTVQVHNRDTFAEIGLMEEFVGHGEFHLAKCSITQIVSDSGVENWDITARDTYKPTAFRRNVTSVTFSTLGLNSRTSARWILFFWS